MGILPVRQVPPEQEPATTFPPTPGGRNARALGFRPMARGPVCAVAPATVGIRTYLPAQSETSMLPLSWRQLFQRLSHPLARRGRRPSRPLTRPRLRLRLEALEDRMVPSGAPLCPTAHHDDVTVMTYNLHDGTDLTPLFTVQSPQQIPGAVSQVLAEVTASDIPARAVALAHVIEQAHPDLVGVQEAAVWSVNGAVRYDLLGDVVQALAHDGAHYRVASVAPEFGGQLPDAQGEIVGVNDSFGVVGAKRLNQLVVHADRQAI